MTFHGPLRISPARRASSSIARGRRSPMKKPVLEGLEERLVLSQAPAFQAAQAVPAFVDHGRVAAATAQRIEVPITIGSINVTDLTPDASTGALNFNGTMTGTILGQTFSTNLTGSAIPGRNPRMSPRLELAIRPINLNLLGLSVATSGIRVDLSAGRDGDIGNLLRGGLDAAFRSAASGFNAGTTAELNALLGSSPMLYAFNSTFGQASARLRSFTPAQGGGGPIVDLALRPTRLNIAGLNERVDNGSGGPIVVDLTGVPNNGLLGEDVYAIAGRPRGRLLNQEVAGALNQIASTPVLNFSTIAAKSVPPAAPTVLADPTLVTLTLNPIDVNLLGLEVKTSQIVVNISAQPGSGELLGNLLTTVANLVNLQAVNGALNNVLGNVVALVNSSSLSVSGINAGPLTNAPSGTTPVLSAHIAPVHLDLLGALVDTSPIDLSITAHSGPGLLLGNVVTDLANLLNNPPRDGDLSLNRIIDRLQRLNDQLAAQIPGIAPAPVPSPTTTPGTTNVLSLVVPPINLNLLGLILQTDTIRVNADAQSGNGLLLGNLLTQLLNSLNGTPQQISALNAQVNTLLAKVVGVLNATSLNLPTNALGTLSPALQTLALPNLVNTSGAPASASVLNLNIASPTGTTPPVDVNLLGLVVTTGNIHAQLNAQTGNGQILGNLVYNVAHLLDPGGNPSLLPILTGLGL